MNPFRYAGEMQDALTGHYYLRARFYNPIIARFTQEDTYRGDGLNLYAYVANNPIRYVDPSGYAKAASGGTPASCVKIQRLNHMKDGMTFWRIMFLENVILRLLVKILLTPKTHEVTKEVYRDWLRENYGKPLGISPGWSNMSKVDAMKLTHDMFEAAKVPQGIRDEYFELFDIFITGG